jgi:hypothetical protein
MREVSMSDVYKWAKQILYKHPTPKHGVELILKRCQHVVHNPFWSSCREWDFETDRIRIREWLFRALTHPRRRPKKDITILWLGLHDVEDRFDLRGSNKWSKDPEDWGWCAQDDYCFYEDDPPQLMAGCGSKIMEGWCSEMPESVTKLKNAHQMGSWFATLVYAALLGEEFFRIEAGEVILGTRSERWLAVGHPDSEYGIILGRRTKTKWIPFRE